MKVVGVKELKARLSEFLRMARAGEIVLVTDRGEDIAELRPTRREVPAVDDLDRVHDALAEVGEINWAAMAKGNWTFRAEGLGLPAGTARALLDEIRGERTGAERAARCTWIPPPFSAPRSTAGRRRMSKSGFATPAS